MSARRVVILKLLGATSVTDVVGNKIWPTVAEEGVAEPYILIHGPGKENRQLLENDAGFPRSRVRVECVGGSAAAAESLAEKVFDVLKNVTNELVTDGESPPEFVVTASITPTDFNTDSYSDVRSAFVEIADFYVDWRSS